VSVTFGAFGAAGIAATSLMRNKAEREVPADDGSPTDPVHGLAGLEPAWSHYLAIQAANDALTAGAQVVATTSQMWQRIGDLRKWFADEFDDFIPRVTFRPFLLLPYAAGVSATLGVMTATAASGIILGGVAGVLWIIRRGSINVVRLVDRVQLRRSGAAATCTTPGCFGHTQLPIVECRCGRFHLDLKPGHYGVVRRRCTCGALIPTTATRATPTLRLRCPWCREPLWPGSMLDRNIRVAMVGAKGAGKTSVVNAGIRAIGATVAHTGGGLELLTPHKPDGGAVPCIAARITFRRRCATLHVFDAPGEIFENSVYQARLNYLRETQSVVLVIDAIALPWIAARIDNLRSEDGGAVDPELTYHAVVAQLADDRVDLRRRSLAVVLHKADLLEVYFRGRGPAPGSENVKQWLAEYGHRNLVQACERDFGEVRYFLTSSDSKGATSPGAALRWLVESAGFALPNIASGNQ